MAEQSATLSRPIVQSWMNSNWEIHRPTAMVYMAEYLEDLQLISDGVQINYEERREQARPIILEPGQLDMGNGRRTSRLDAQDIPRGSIAVFKLQGAMRVRDGWSSTGIQTLANQIMAADENPNIGGILLQIDSGGGEAVAATILMNAINEISTPIHGYILMMASAALRGTLPIDQLTAAGPDVIVGSIGTMAVLNKKAAKWMEENQDELYATNSYSKNKSIRAYLNGDNGPIIEELDKINEVFLEQVEQYRVITGSEEQQDRVFSGDIFLSNEAVQIGLIDQIGSINQAIEGLRFDMEQTYNKRKQRPRSGRFNNQNSTDMNFSQFWNKARNLFQTKFNLEVAEDATAEQVLAAIENAEGIEDMEQRVQTNVLNILRQEMEPQTNEPGDTDEPPVETPEANQSTEMQEMREMIQGLQEQISTLTESNGGLSQRVAKLTGRQLDKGEKGNSQQVEPLKPATQTSEVPGTSKY